MGQSLVEPINFKEILRALKGTKAFGLGRLGRLRMTAQKGHSETSGCFSESSAKRLKNPMIIFLPH